MRAYCGHIDRETLKNTFFRKVLFTGEHSQLVVMCLAPGEEIGQEVHADVDQFFRIEQGRARFVFNSRKIVLVREGDAVVVPAGTVHNVQNASRGLLKLYTVYSPPNHPPRTVHKTRAAAERAEARQGH
jgi:mannose-6-phosphate isomerase-like protein (cupin superfamily)